MSRALTVILLVFYILLVNTASAETKYSYFTMTQGEEKRYSQTVTAGDAMYAWADASGDAASWVTPRYLDFGLVDKGMSQVRDYTINVPDDQNPGTYELRWKFGCKYVSFKQACSFTGDTVLQIIVKAKPPPVDTYEYLTLTQGEEKRYSQTVTAGDTKYVWADASGDAASWVTPRHLDFGLVDKGTSQVRDYTINVPDDQNPGTYELRLKFGCKYVSGKTCSTVGDTVLQITVKAKPPPVDTYEYLTMTQGEKKRYSQTVTAGDAMYAWADASGDAASWVTPRRLDFGLVDKGTSQVRDYTIKVPDDQNPGNYELRLKFGCKYVSGETCSFTGDTVLQITINEKPAGSGYIILGLVLFLVVFIPLLNRAGKGAKKREEKPAPAFKPVQASYPAVARKPQEPAAKPQANELKELKEKLLKTNQLLDKLDERLVEGELTEAKYKELAGKYKAEADSLKNQIAEKELLSEVGLKTE